MLLRRSWRQVTRLVPAVHSALGVAPWQSSVRYLSDGEGNGGGEIWDPSQMCDLAQAADGVAIAQQANEHWPVVGGVQHALEWIHASTGCPWWLSICMVTVAFRCLIFPVTLVQIRNSVKLSVGCSMCRKAWCRCRACRMRCRRWMQRKQNFRNPWQKDSQLWYQTEIARIWKKHDCHPVKSMTPLFANGFVFVSFFIALRGLSEIKVPSMCYEGLFWFKDLTMADPYYILPVLNSLIFWITIELGAADGMQGTAPETIGNMKNVMRILAVIFVPITASFPSSLFCYWITSSCFSLVQSRLIKRTAVRNALGLPASVKRETDPFKNPIFARPVKTMNEEGEAKPIKPTPLTAGEIRSLWKERLESVLKGQEDVKDGAPVVYTSEARRKQKKTRMRRTKRA